jgi:hypothetical protein
MVIDVHAYYVPRDGQRVAAEIDKRHNLKLEQNERGWDLVARDGYDVGDPEPVETVGCANLDDVAQKENFQQQFL